MSTFNWENDAIGFYNRFHAVFVAAAILYYPTIFGIRYWLTDKKAFDLGGAPAAVKDESGKTVKDKDGKINYYDTEEDACLTCGMYEFENAWVMKLIYNHIEKDMESWE